MPVTADSIAHDMRAMLRLVAEPVEAGEGVAAQIRRAAARTRLSFARARRLWYGEATVSAVDLVQVMAAVQDAADRMVVLQDERALRLRQLAQAAIGRSGAGS